MALCHVQRKVKASDPQDLLIISHGGSTLGLDQRPCLYYSAKAVSAYLKTEQILPFDFARKYMSISISISIIGILKSDINQLYL